MILIIRFDNGILSRWPVKDFCVEDGFLHVWFHDHRIDWIRRDGLKMPFEIISFWKVKYK